MNNLSGHEAVRVVVVGEVQLVVFPRLREVWEAGIIDVSPLLAV